jgi:hypothetical protein
MFIRANVETFKEYFKQNGCASHFSDIGLAIIFETIECEEDLNPSKEDEHVDCAAISSRYAECANIRIFHETFGKEWMEKYPTYDALEEAAYTINSPFHFFADYLNSFADGNGDDVMAFMVDTKGLKL